MIEEEVFISYGFREFITDVGGLLGLFLGCSMLSLMELIYYPVMAGIRYWKMRKSSEKVKREVENSHNSFEVATGIQQMHENLNILPGSVNDE